MGLSRWLVGSLLTLGALTGCGRSVADSGVAQPPPSARPEDESTVTVTSVAAPAPDSSFEGDVPTASTPPSSAMSTRPASDAYQVGDSIAGDDPPAGIRDDGSVDLSAVPEWIPVGRDGFVIGFVRSAELYGPPVLPGEPQRPLEIYDELGDVIGEFRDGLPVLYGE